MDSTQLNAALARVFSEDNARIVFWNDPEGEFAESLPALQLDDVQLLRLDELGALEVKLKLEREDQAGKYLLYLPEEEPELDADWLLDIRLYSRSFRADRASIILDELGLANQSMRSHIALRRKFFDNKERLQKLKQLVVPNDNEELLDRKMLAVVAKADQPELFNILRTIYHSLGKTEELELDGPTAILQQIEKFELDESFWKLVQAAFGYAEENPNLQNLLIRLFVADFAQHLGVEKLPAGLQALRLPDSGALNAVVCLAQWRDSASKGESYNRLADVVASLIHIDTYLSAFEIEDLLDVMTFPDVEKTIISGLLDRVAGQAEVIDSDMVRSIANRRQVGHWVASHSVPEATRKAIHAVYQSMMIAADLFALRNQYAAGFSFDSAKAMFVAYGKTLYQFDQLYRLFCENADLAEARGWHMLKPLRQDVEAVYGNWYLTQLGLAWGKHVEAGLLGHWRLEGIPNQFDFFAGSVQPRLDEADNRRVFVVISDAFRYEVAQELTSELNGKYRFKAELNSQLGVLPSYTALGMASLLPHKRLAYKANGEVLVDDQPTSSLAQREAILGSVDGMAIKAEDMLALSKEAGRERVADYRVVYVYHNEIDARGDSASTESGTFDAARKAINDVADVVRYIVNNLNGHNVLVTADHGFLFTETAPDETDKSKLLEKPAGTVTAKKRYLIGLNLGDNEGVWHGSTDVSAVAEGGMEYWTPKAANRFHFTGGARFVHGGAMLQEIVVPIVLVTHARGARDKQATRTRQVTVQVLGNNPRVTAQKHRFRLVQMEAVNDRFKPAKLKVAIYEGDEAITSIETVTFNSTSGDLDARQKDVLLTLQDRPYDKRTPYRLVLRDADTDIEQQSVPVIIDRVIADDFDF